MMYKCKQLAGFKNESYELSTHDQLTPHQTGLAQQTYFLSSALLYASRS